MAQLPTIKEEFDILTIPLDGWNPFASDTFPSSSSLLSTGITQSVSNQFSLTVTSSNDSTTTRSHFLNANNDKTCSSAFVHENPMNRHDLAKKAERSNNIPFIANRSKFSLDGFNAQQKPNIIRPPLNFVSQLKQTQEQLKELTEKFVENKNAYETLQKKHDELQLDYFQFKVNANESFQQKDEQIRVLQCKVDYDQQVSNISTCGDVLQMIKEIQGQLVASQLEHSQFRNKVDRSLEESDEQIKSLQAEINELRALNASPLQSTCEEPTLPTVSNHEDVDLIVPNNDDDSTTENEDDLSTQSEPRRSTRKRKPSRVAAALVCQGGRDAKKAKSTNSEMSRVTARQTARRTRENNRYTVVSLDCTEEDCPTKLNSVNDLHDHLKKHHKLKPHRCFASECNHRFDNPTQLSAHIASHDYDVEFVCPGCSLEIKSKGRAYDHWKSYHLTGKYQCNNCSCVKDTRKKISNHLYLGCGSKRFACKHPGCTATFGYHPGLRRHRIVHL